MSTWCPSLREGQLLARRFRVAGRLKAAATSSLYRGVDEVDGSPIKIRQAPGGADGPRRHREAAILAMLDHHQVPRFLASFEEDGCAYVVCSYLEGPTLLQHARDAGTLPKARLPALLRSLLVALDHLHTRPTFVVHRDIKPGNLVLMDASTVGIIDFDIARAGTRNKHQVAIDDLTHAYTAGFAPPEQAIGRESYPGSDLYAAAASFLFVTTGYHPIHLWNAREGRVAVPRCYAAPVRALLTWMLEPGLDRRCPSARAAMAQLPS